MFYVARNNLEVQKSYQIIEQKFIEEGWLYLRGPEDRDIPQLQSFRATIRRIQKKHIKVLPNYILLHEVNLI